MKFVVVQINPNESQLKKLLKGQSVNLKAEQLLNGRDMMLSKRLSGKIATAKKNNKGLRVFLTPQELKKNFTGEGLIDDIKNFYNKNIKSHVRGGLKKASSFILDEIGDKIPIPKTVKAPVKGLLKTGLGDIIDFIGDKTGGFGTVQPMNTIGNNRIAHNLSMKGMGIFPPGPYGGNF